MILAHGALLPDSELDALLSNLEEDIDKTLAEKSLPAEAVIAALDALGKRLERGEFAPLLARYLPPGTTAEDLLPLLRREALEDKVRVELGPRPSAPADRGETTARRVPLGALLHVAAGNQPGLPVYSVVEGLLAGNVNLLKLPREDGGLSLAALGLLCEQEPALADYIYAFDLPSSHRAALARLCALADGAAVWGGDGAVRAIRELAPPGCRLIEWGHRLGFAYVSGYEDRERELAALARHIVETEGRLCSSCQVVFLDAEDRGEGESFCRTFLPHLEQAARELRGPVVRGARAALYGRTALLSRVVHGETRGEKFFPGKGCSLALRPDEELELSPMEGNVLVKLLPRARLLPALRRQKGRLQTAGLLCSPDRREELTGLLLRAGVVRVTRAGDLSAAFPGQGHDGEYPLLRYTRVADVEN